MPKREGEWVVSEIGRRMKKARSAYKKVRDRPEPVPPTEQLRRFLTGEERHRLESGEVTPTQWVEYEAAMLEKLQGRQ